MGIRKSKGGKLTFEQKMEKDFPEFTDGVNSMNIQKMESEIARYTKESQDSDEAKKESEALKAAQYELSLIVGPFRDFKRDVSKKTKYLISMIRSKGGM